jgi:hypothetical protein
MSSSQGSAELQRMDTPLGSLSFRQAGAAAPTHVLLHGIGSASCSWQAQLAWAQGRSDVGLLAWDARRQARGDKPWALPLKIGTHTVTGVLALRALALLKPLRPYGSRFHAEHR